MLMIIVSIIISDDFRFVKSFFINFLEKIFYCDRILLNGGFNMKFQFKKILSVFLVFILVFSLLQTNIIAKSKNNIPVIVINGIDLRKKKNKVNYSYGYKYGYGHTYGYGYGYGNEKESGLH